MIDDREPRTTRDLYLRIERDARHDWPDAPHPAHHHECSRWPLRHWAILLLVETIAVGGLIALRCHG